MKKSELRAIITEAIKEVLAEKLAFEDKDMRRINDMVRKTEGDVPKMLKLAQNMANSIDDVAKAKRRADAAKSMFKTSKSGVFNKIAAIFTARYNELQK